VRTRRKRKGEDRRRMRRKRSGDVSEGEEKERRRRRGSIAYLKGLRNWWKTGSQGHWLHLKPKYLKQKKA
jgi:hypothetical protein